MLRRASETAEIIATVLDCHFFAEPALCEMFHATFTGMRDFVGLTAAEAAAEFPRLANPEDLEGKWWPDMPEAQQQCDRRVAEALRDLLPNLQADQFRWALLIGHGATCAAMMRHLLPGPDEGGQDCCGLSLVTLGAGGKSPSLEFHNDTSHLP